MFPAQKCGVHGSDSFPELLNGVACQEIVVSIRQKPYQLLLCGFFAVYKLAMYLVAGGDAKALQLWQWLASD